MTPRLTAAQRADLEREAGTPAQLADAKAAKAGRKPRTLLPSPPPDEAAPAGEHAAWTTIALNLADPITDVRRYGRHEDARMVAELRSGARITFDRQAEAFDPRILVRRVVLASGATVPHYNAADAQAIATALVRAADLLDHDDDRSEAREWGRTFLAAARPNLVTVASTASAAGRYEALAALAGWTPPASLPPHAPPADRSPLVADADGLRLARTSDVAAHVRGLAGRPIAWAALHGRMAEVGWEHRGEVQQRQPSGGRKIKAHVYAIAAGWEAE